MVVDGEYVGCIGGSVDKSHQVPFTLSYDIKHLGEVQDTYEKNDSLL